MPVRPSRRKRSSIFTADGLLVLDVNGNGTIDSGRELFGDNTRLGTGSNATNASNGYQAIGQYDSNGDGQINSTDTIYSQLRVWRDLNQDGISQAGELQTRQRMRACLHAAAAQPHLGSLRYQHRG